MLRHYRSVGTASTRRESLGLPDRGGSDIVFQITLPTISPTLPSYDESDMEVPLTSAGSAQLENLPEDGLIRPQ